MQDQRLTLMALLAHPDDEVWTGATLAKYAEQGVRTVLVTGTLGEEGEIRDPDLNPEEARRRLGEIREAELRRSVQILGISQHYVLGFRDSGMAGTPANDDPRNFHNATREEVLRRLLPIVRRERPQVIICDNERGTYGHPDHVAAHGAAIAAFETAGDPTQLPELGLAPWQPQKLYYTAFARSDYVRLRDLLRERGISWGDDEESEDWLDFTTPDELVTTRIDSRAYRSRVRAAMQVHRTQIAPDDPFVTMPEELDAQIMGINTFVRARSLVDAPLPEDDLFAGIRDEMNTRMKIAIGHSGAPEKLD